MTAPLVCEWFALCTRPAAAWVKHPTLGLVPTCQYCIDKRNLGSRVDSMCEGRGPRVGDGPPS